MALTPTDVRRIAELARLDLGAAEEALMLEQINSFFRIVEQMSAVDTRGVEPLYTPLAAVQRRPPPAARGRRHRGRRARRQPAERAGGGRGPVSRAAGDRMSTAALHELGVAALGRALRERKVSSVEATQPPARPPGRPRAPRRRARVDPERALAQARAADARLAAGGAGPLVGRADRPQGHLRHPRPADHRRLAHARRLPEPVRRDRRRPPRRRPAW